MSTSSSPSVPSASAPSSSVAAFDYRDEETKAKFLSMIGGGGKGGGERKGRRSGERKAKSPITAAAAGPSGDDGGLPASSSFSLTSSSAEPSPSTTAAEEGVGEASAASGGPKKKKAQPRSPKAAEMGGGSTPSTPPSTSSALKGRVGGKAAALAALSSRLKGVVSASTPASASATPTSIPSSPSLDPTRPNGVDGSPGSSGVAPHSLLDPSPSTAAIAFFSPDPSQSSALSQASAAVPTAAAADGVDEGGAEVPAASASGAAAALAEDEEEDEEEDDDAHTIEHVEPSDAVKGVHRREQLEAMERDDQLKQTLPWHSSNSTSTPAPASREKAGGKSTPPSLLVRRSVDPSPSSSPSPPAELGSLVPSPDLTAPSTPLDEGDSPLTVANDYDLPPAAKPLHPPHAAAAASSAPSSSSSSSSSTFTSASSSAAAGGAGLRGGIASSSSSSLAPPTSASSYVPFTPSPTYFANPMLPDLSAHGHHVKLILYPIRRQKRKVLLPLQSHCCPECGAALRNRMFSRPRYCYYTGLYYCRQCHVKQKAVLPGRVLWYGDIRRYKVCKMAFAYLDSIYAVPVLPMSAINPSLYRASKRLRFAFLLRQQLAYLRPFIDECDHRSELLVLFGERTYMLNDTPVLSTSSRGIRTSFLDIVHTSEHAVADPAHSARDMYSLRDIIEIISNQLTEKLSLLVSTLIAHVVHSDCEACGSKGAHCEGDGCDDRVPIYSFQVGGVIGCEQCGSLFHRRCWNGEDTCPHCRRHSDAQQSVVVAHRLADQVRRTGGGGGGGGGGSAEGAVQPDRRYDEDDVVSY